MAAELVVDFLSATESLDSLGASDAAPTHTNANDVARALETHKATVRLSRAVAEVLEPLRLAAPFLEVDQ